jgi:hypothetical protein
VSCRVVLSSGNNVGLSFIDNVVCSLVSSFAENVVYSQSVKYYYNIMIVNGRIVNDKSSTN